MIKRLELAKEGEVVAKIRSRKLGSFSLEAFTINSMNRKKCCNEKNSAKDAKTWLFLNTQLKY